MSHSTPLPGGSWSLWRCMVLRGTGFPVQGVLRVAAPESAAAADHLLDLESRIAVLYQEAVAELHAALDELRRSGGWGDKPRRKRLLNGFKELKKGATPRGVEEYPALAAACQASSTVRGELAGARSDFTESYASGREQVSRELEALLADDRFREAVTWQNRSAVDVILRGFRGDRGARKRGSQRRQREEMLANYLQRYSVKNDTVGFFGPVGWAWLSDSGDAVRLRPGAQLLERREVYFENWAIEALTRKLGRDPALRPFLAPRLRSSCHLAGEVLYVPFKAPIELPRDHARVLALCDGRRVARALAAEILADQAVGLATEAEVFEVLQAFCQKRILVWNLEVPMELYPERSLAAQLEKVKDEAVRSRAEAALADLDGARRQVAAAAGDANALGTALGHLDRTFTRLTGLSPSRHHGQTYAARGLVYEDCRRAIAAEIGPEVVRRLGPPLSLILNSARWMASELTRRVEERMRAVYAQLRERGGSEAVDSYAFLSQVLSSLFLKRQRDACFAEVEQAFRERWAKVFDLPSDLSCPRVQLTAAGLADRVDREFADAGRTWSLTRYFGPDVMIAADSAEAARRGDFQIVLGELHSGNCMSWSCFISQHPAPEEIRRDVGFDMDHHFDSASRSFVLPQLPRQTQTQRMAPGFVLPRFYRFKLSDEPLDHAASGDLPAGEVVVFETPEKIMARTRDGRLSFDAIDLIGAHLTNECSTILGSLLAPAAHWPRITVDDVVISRERWRFAASDPELGAIRDAGERFLAVRRWARAHGLPRFCFYKFSHEPKPCYLDFDSPIYVDIFVKMLRAALRDPTKDHSNTAGRPGVAPPPRSDSFSISEMLPRVDQAWLTDAEGNRYTCELRTVTHEGQLA